MSPARRELIAMSEAAQARSNQYSDGLPLTYCLACHNGLCKSPAQIHSVSGDSTVSS